MAFEPNIPIDWETQPILFHYTHVQSRIGVHGCLAVGAWLPIVTQISIAGGVMDLSEAQLFAFSNVTAEEWAQVRDAVLDNLVVKGSTYALPDYVIAPYNGEAN